ncbi:hypothetical protein CASFOL_032072 [Castilleja foliolosa]|uniref:Rapid alkalinization factor-like n=1 Tax=Castilleja foliolosa TaxID=1961234 RepID=A0ABD3C0H3_9LAMI
MSGSWKMLLALFLITALLLSQVSAGGGDHYQASAADWMLPAVRSGCRGTVAECLDDEQEFDLDSESNRRILATRRYISYGALQRNNVPCSRRGTSYYNCRAGARANPYSRGCTTITRCRR